MTVPVVELGPAPLDISGVRAGDRNRFALTLKQGGVPLSLVGCTVSAQARTDTTSPTPLDAVIDMLDAPNGKLAVRWPGAAVATWLGSRKTARGVWDLQVDDGTGLDPLTVVAGAFSAEMDVTR